MPPFRIVKFSISIVLLGFEGVAAARHGGTDGLEALMTGGEEDVSFEGKPDAVDSRWMCQDVNGMRAESSKPEIWEFLEKRHLTSDYQSLVKELHSAPTAWHGGYKGSALSQAMFHHDKAFEARGAKMIILRSKHHMRHSKFRLCIVDAGTHLPSEETALPYKLYGDGIKAKITCHKGEGSIKRMEDGVVAQSKVKDLIQVEQWQVEVQRLFAKKDAMALLEDFKQALKGFTLKKESLFDSIRPYEHKSEAYAALMVKLYEKRFADMGVGLIFNVKESRCCCGDKCSSQCDHRYKWFEFVDLAVKTQYSSPNSVTNTDLAANYVRCTPTGSEVRMMLKKNGLSFKHTRNSPRSNKCAEIVEAATDRLNPDSRADCKCPWKMSVYCGSRKLVENGKFSSSTIQGLCRNQDLYCSDKSCPDQA